MACSRSRCLAAVYGVSALVVLIYRWKCSVWGHVFQKSRLLIESYGRSDKTQLSFGVAGLNSGQGAI